MNFLGKLENGYLQFVRIIFLILATLALVVAVVSGIPALVDFNAKPAAVPADISISATSFRLAGDDAAAQPHAANADALDPQEKEKAALIDALHSVIVTHGKKLVGNDFTYDKDNLSSAVDSWTENADQGVEFVKAQTRFLDEVLSRADVVKRVSGSSDAFFTVVGSGLRQFGSDWQKQKDSIATKKVAAEADASAKRVGALQSLSIVAGAVGVFITLVISLIMFRVDRSIRKMANARATV